MSVHPRACAALLLLVTACDPAGERQSSAAASSATPSLAPSATSTSGAAATAVSSGTVAASNSVPAVASAAASASSASTSVANSGAVPANMVHLPASVFLMGSYGAVGNPEEHPAHEAIVAGFYLDKTEVTVGAYRKCVEAGGCKPAHMDHRFCDYESKDKLNYPINCVDLHQATAFCKWAIKRLPTEREWEYAGTNGSKRQPFSWGTADPVPQKNACYDHPGGSCPVGSYAPGAFGLLDMTGNVWEWTSSRFKNYPSRPLGDEIVAGKNYVYKGGSWSRRFSKWMRNWLRNRYQPNKYSASIGMRCAKSTAPLECPPETAAKDGYCARDSGTPMCEPRHHWDGNKCRLGGELSPRAGVSAPTSSSSAGASAAPTASVDPSAPIQVSRSRTPQHDKDCKRHWPKTPASYLFKGGPNYPSRKPIVRAAGCVPRDMSWGWTSACCKQ